jgi:CRISPR-associated protein Csc2
MSILENLKSAFHPELPYLPSGKYVHFLMVRHSQSFPVFQTDGVLNTARTESGLENNREKISRVVMFKRKQVTPERLSGRELLRSLSLTSSQEGSDNYCQYNGEKSCKKCPDCVIYGFAIGDKGSERSKVYSDSAFSLNPYEVSHRSFTFNAPAEAGSMSEKGEMRNALGELDHVLPEVTFPSVETLRDPTYEGFLYVLGNLVRTKRYGAQESRTGTMDNRIVGIVLCDGEIFSNLHFTQALYDKLDGKTDAGIDEICQQAKDVVESLLSNEPVRKNNVIFGEELKNLMTEVLSIYQDETKLQENMQKLYTQTETYARTHGAFAGNKDSKDGKNKGKKK